MAAQKNPDYFREGGPASVPTAVGQTGGRCFAVMSRTVPDCRVCSPIDKIWPPICFWRTGIPGRFCWCSHRAGLGRLLTAALVQRRKHVLRAGDSITKSMKALLSAARGNRLATSVHVRAGFVLRNT